MGFVADNAHGPASRKFLRRFFQKAATFLSFEKPATPRGAGFYAVHEQLMQA
jgi:hypothetical protein